MMVDLKCILCGEYCTVAVHPPTEIMKGGKYTKDDDYHYVRCNSCGFRGPRAGSVHDALKIHEAMNKLLKLGMEMNDLPNLVSVGRSYGKWVVFGPLGDMESGEDLLAMFRSFREEDPK